MKILNMPHAFIGIGSNLKNRRQNCLAAIGCLSHIPKTKIESISRWYETPARTLNGESQPDYINGAVKIFTKLTPLELLRQLQEIEIRMGRRRQHKKWAPRIIDLDLLLYDDLILSESGLSLPHPEITKRIFVLKPLCDMEPERWHPILKRPLKELLDYVAPADCRLVDLAGLASA